MKRAIVTFLVAIFATAVFGQVKTEVKPESLPSCLKEWVKTNMKDYSILKGYKMETKTPEGVVVTYYVCVEKGKERFYLSSDEACHKVKKITKDEFEGKIAKPPKPVPQQSAKPAKQQSTEKADEGTGKQK